MLLLLLCSSRASDSHQKPISQEKEVPSVYPLNLNNLTYSYLHHIKAPCEVNTGRDDGSKLSHKNKVIAPNSQNLVLISEIYAQTSKPCSFEEQQYDAPCPTSHRNE